MIKQRIIQYIDFKGISKYKFYQDTAFSNGFLDKEGHIGSDKCERISYVYPDLSLEWLVTGKGVMLKRDTATVSIKQSGGIPLVTPIAVGGFGNSHFAIKERDVKEYYTIPKFQYKKIDFMIEVEGSSMYPKYNSGDVVACCIIKETSFIQWNKTHVVATKEQGIIIKRVKQGTTDKSLLMISDNKDYPEFEVPKKEIEGIALVVGVIRLE